MINDINNKKNNHNKDNEQTKNETFTENGALANKDVPNVDISDDSDVGTQQDSVKVNADDQKELEIKQETKIQDAKESNEIDELKSQIEKLTQEVATYKDKWLRTEADLDNYKKRVHKERLEQLKYGYESLIRELLPVIDNLERAIEYSKKHAQKDSLYEGVELTLKLLKKVIEGFGVNEIESVGKLFDPSLHEGVGVEEGEDYEDNVIIKELEKGYLYRDRLIRPAKVIVGRKNVSANVNEQT